MEDGGEGVCVSVRMCVSESQQASSAVVRLCTSRGLIPWPPALAYTPLTRFLFFLSATASPSLLSVTQDT